MIANEVLDWKLKTGDTGLLCKLNIERVFDQLNWAYLSDILKKMVFGNIWIRWIHICIFNCKILCSG